MNGKLFLALFFAFFFGKLPAQQFGAFPPSTDWQQLNTDSLRIIFTKPVTPQAERIAAIIQQMARQNANPLGSSVRKINILLHPNTTLANGYVALGPFRSEYYLIPGSNIFEFGATPWTEELAVHEYRHVLQYSNFNNGLSKTAGVIFGQLGQALFNALAVPDWFFEGDAVHSETAYTTQGRGRAPYFFNGYRSLWQDKRNYSWMKLRNGSLKDYVPDHYQLGYLLTNYGYQKYGPDFWGKVTDKASRFNRLFYPFQGAVKNVSGQDFKAFRQEALDYYQNTIAKTAVQQRRETVTNYLFPQLIGDDSLLYIKTAYNKIPAFYIKDRDGEHRIKQRNITGEDWLSYRSGTVAYTAYAPDPRWGLTDYSNIYLLNLLTGEEKKLTNKQRYFTPDLSPDGSRLAAVYFNDSTGSEIHVLNSEGGVLQKIQPLQKGDLFVHPRYIDDHSLVVAVRHADATMSLQRILLGDHDGGIEKFELLLSPSASMVGYPFVDGNKIYFVSSATGIDEVFSLDLNSPLPATKLSQLTSGTTGSYYPSVYKNRLVWSSFTSNGFRMKDSLLSSLHDVYVDVSSFQHRTMPYPVASDAAAPNLLQTAGSAHLPVQPYKKSTGLFNFHSRQLYYSDPELTVSFLSNNILNTFSNEIFYRYNQNESSHAVGLASYYGGFFPVLNAGITYTANRDVREASKAYTANQFETQFGFSIPLNFSQGKTYKFLSFGSNYVYNETRPAVVYKDSIHSKSAGYLYHFINWSQQLPTALQHIYPKFAYAISLSERHLVNGDGAQFLGGTALYLPSIKNHSLVLTANLQETDTRLLPQRETAILPNRFANSRGYNDYYFSRMWRLGGNYHMPLFYPDWGVGNILYFLRVRSNVFYDYTKVYSPNKLVSREQRSVGGEIYFDTRWWNMLPVSFGFRVSHLLDDDFSGQRPKGSNIFEFIIPMNLIP